MRFKHLGLSTLAVLGVALVPRAVRAQDVRCYDRRGDPCYARDRDDLRLDRERARVDRELQAEQRNRRLAEARESREFDARIRTAERVDERMRAIRVTQLRVREQQDRARLQREVTSLNRRLQLRPPRFR
jgi:hypothetical protein